MPSSPPPSSPSSGSSPSSPLTQWLKLLRATLPPKLHETDPVWLPAEALTPARPLPVLSAAALTFALLKELSGEAALEREQTICACETPPAKATRQNLYLTTTHRRFTGIRRCC